MMSKVAAARRELGPFGGPLSAASVEVDDAGFTVAHVRHESPDDARELAKLSPVERVARVKVWLTLGARVDRSCSQNADVEAIGRAATRQLETKIEWARHDIAGLRDLLRDQSATRAANERTTGKGASFESDFEQFLTRAARARSDAVECVKNLRGSAKSARGNGLSLAGDFVVTVGDGPAVDKRIVIDAKAGEDMKKEDKCRALLQLCRKNRCADLAMLVFRDTESMPPAARPIRFYDEGVVVSVECFEVAYQASRWLLSAQGGAAALNAKDCQRAAASITNNLKRLDTIKNHLSCVSESVNRMREEADSLKEDVKAALVDLEDAAAKS